MVCLFSLCKLWWKPKYYLYNQKNQKSKPIWDSLGVDCCSACLCYQSTLKYWIHVFLAGYCSSKSEMVDGYLDNYVSNKLNETTTNSSNSYCRRLTTAYEPALPPLWLCFYFLYPWQRSSLYGIAGCVARC